MRGLGTTADMSGFSAGTGYSVIAKATFAGPTYQYATDNVRIDNSGGPSVTVDITPTYTSPYVISNMVSSTLTGETAMPVPVCL